MGLFISQIQSSRPFESTILDLIRIMFLPNKTPG